MIVADIASGLSRLDAIGNARLPPGAGDKLAAYLELLAKWNRTYNLTAIREPEKMVTHHVLDSLAVLPHLQDPKLAKSLSLLDVGSGAGLPAVPLAIARPAWRVVALDSSQKKGTFVRQAASELSLANLEAVVSRVEGYLPVTLFDVVISRAFSDLATFAESSARHLVPGGRLVAMKGVRPDEEIAQLPPAYHVVETVPLAVPGIDAARHLVIMECR